MTKNKDIIKTIERVREDIASGAEGLVFDPVPHEYTWRGKPVKSVSAVCEVFEAPFDSAFWAKKKAEQAGVSPGEILESWQSISSKACEEGTDVHAYGEWRFHNAVGTDSDDPDVLRASRQADASDKDIRLKAIDDVWKWLENPGKGFKLYPVAAENRIVNPSLGYAGTFDLLFLCVRDNGDKGLVVFDYKTNKNLFNIYKSYNGSMNMMRFPFHNMPDCNAAHYSCQLSLYQLGLERVTDIPVIGRVLFWVNPLGVAVIDKNNKDTYRAAHKKLTERGEKSKWDRQVPYIEDIARLKRFYGFSRQGLFGMLRLPYLGDAIKAYLKGKG